MNQLQRAQNMQDMALAAAHREDKPEAEEEYTWLKMLPPPRQVSMPGVRTGRSMFMDVASPGSTVAPPSSSVAAPPVQEVAARAPVATSENEMAAPPMQEAAANGPGVKALFGIALTGDAVARAPGAGTLFGVAPTHDAAALALGSSVSSTVARKPSMKGVSRGCSAKFGVRQSDSGSQKGST